MIEELLRYMTHRLDQLGLEFMLSGSLAMNLYTTPRMTRDIDLIIEISEAKVEAFSKIFSERFYCHKPSILDAIERKSIFNLIDNQSGYKVDFIVRKNSTFRKTEFARKQKKSVLGIETWVVSVEDLILSKLIWIQDFQSHQQMDDIRNLMVYEKINRQYLNKWIDELSLKTFELI